MAGSLQHMPANILRWLLISEGYGTRPILAVTQGAPVGWPIGYSESPNQPDNAIWLIDSTGQADGDCQPDGEVQTHYGFQVLLRATDETTGARKMNDIYVFFSRLERKRVVVDRLPYLVDNVSKISNIIPLGSEPGSKRVVYSLNAYTTLRQIG